MASKTPYKCAYCEKPVLIYYESKIGKGGWHIGCETSGCKGHIDNGSFDTIIAAIKSLNPRTIVVGDMEIDNIKECCKDGYIYIS